MSRSTHQIAVKGVDETAGVFASVQARAAAASAKVRSLVGGALASAGAYLSVRSIMQTVNDLGAMSDMAMRAGASVDEMTRAAAAFQVAGLPVTMQSLSTALMWMQKNTGKQGMGAFLETARQIAAIGDGAERGAELVRNFGRAGLMLQPLVSGGADVVDKFVQLQSLMPGVAQSAADAGDSVADAQTILSSGVKSLWQNAIGRICELWGEEFPGGVRAGALNAANWVEYALKKMYHYVVAWGAKIGAAGQALFNWIANDYSWEQAWSEYGEVAEMLDRDMSAQLQRIENARDDYKKRLSTMKVDDLANLFGGKGAKQLGETVGETAAKAATRITNDLVLGGSNAASRMAILGPTLQSETKKQTELLQSIDEGVKLMADAQSDAGDNYIATDLGV